jgi:hypothetical protein
MQREQFHELLARAAGICGRRELLVFGSQAVHALTSSPPAEVLVSVECDIWLRDEPESDGGEENEPHHEADDPADSRLPQNVE